MNFYEMIPTPRRDAKILLGTTDLYPGYRIINCPVCGTRGLLPHSLCGKIPVELLVREAGYLDDIEQASTTMLFSKKVRDAVTSAELTGIEFYDPVGYRLKRDTPKFEQTLRQARDELQLKVIDVTGKGGSVAKSSEIRSLKSCNVCGWKAWTLPAHGFHVDEAQWDGTDFFQVTEFAPFFMSERAVNVLASAGLSNFGASRAEDYKLPPGYIE